MYVFFVFFCLFLLVFVCLYLISLLFFLQWVTSSMSRLALLVACHFTVELFSFSLSYMFMKNKIGSRNDHFLSICSEI